MNKPAAIAAQLVDVRNVSTHKCIRMIVEVPAEQAMAVIAAFGWPTGVDPVPVAIARLDLSNARLNGQGAVVQAPTPVEAAGLCGETLDRPHSYCVAEAMGGPRCTKRCEVPKDCGGLPSIDKPATPRKPVAAEKRLAQRAGILCADPVFQQFLLERGSVQSKNEPEATEFIYRHCGIESRRELIPGEPCSMVWQSLHSEFEAWRMV